MISAAQMEADFFSLPGGAVEEGDVILLEALVASPAYPALKRLIDKYRNGSYSMLKTSRDTHDIFRAQGHIIGLDLVERLPALIVKQRQDKLNKVVKEQQDRDAREEKRSDYLKYGGSRPKTKT